MAQPLVQYLAGAHKQVFEVNQKNYQDYSQQALIVHHRQQFDRGVILPQ